MFEFKVSLNDEDYLDFCEYVLKNTPTGKRDIKIKIISYHITLVIMLFIIPSMTLTSINTSYQFYICFFTIILISCLIWFRFIDKLVPIYSKQKMKALKRNLKVMKKKGKLPYNDTEVILTFDDEKLYRKSGESVEEISYSMFSKIIVTENAVYFYDSRNTALILSLRLCSSDAEKQKFLDFINSKIYSTSYEK